VLNDEFAVNQITAIEKDGVSRPVQMPLLQAMGRSREHIAYIQYFRALAIIMIVCGHTFAVAWTHFVDEDPQKTVSLLNVIPALISGGTAYFVFISGFLYRHVFYGRTSYGDFMRKKALYVGLPYVVFGVPFAVIGIVLGVFSVTMVKDGAAYPQSGFVDFIALFTTGRMQVAYWYIPCAFLLFLASPLFDRFIRLEVKWRVAALLATIALALWIHRPVDNLNPVQSFLYVANFYLFGMLFYEYRAAIVAFVGRPPVIAALALAIVAVAAIQALVLQNTSNIEHNFGDGWLPVGLDLMLVQKYVGILLFCGIFSLWGTRASTPLSFVADISFGLFFVHDAVLAVLIRLPVGLSPHIGEPIADLALYTVIVLLISIGIVLAVKRLTGRRSRYIIGC
jgi:peptidoglycan/LPS O-acetylase OafA/YrhL